MLSIPHRMIVAMIGTWLFSVGSLLIAAPQVRLGVNPEPASADAWGDVHKGIFQKINAPGSTAPTP